MENKGPWQTRQVGFRHNRVFFTPGAGQTPSSTIGAPFNLLFLIVILIVIVIVIVIDLLKMIFDYDYD
jgi:hypothetical protein